MVCFGLVIEHDKLEIFHFSRAYNNLNPELDLSTIDAPTLKPKTYWRYLGFYFDQCLFFKEHVWYYSTKILSIVKAIGMHGNSSRGLLPLQKCLLYCSCIVLITTYDFRLWFFARTLIKTQILLLVAMQCKAVLWILSAFHTSPTGGIEALVDLISIHLHLKKLVKWSCLKIATLSSQHALMSLLSTQHSKGAFSHLQFLAFLNNTQYACLKGLLLNTEASLLNFTESFDSLDAKTILDCRLLDNFSDYIFFHYCNHLNLSGCKTYL